MSILECIAVSFEIHKTFNQNKFRSKSLLPVFLRGKAHSALKKYDEALDSFFQAMKLDHSMVDDCNKEVKRIIKEK